MSFAYNAVVNAFLSKITEFEFIQIPEEDRDEIILGYLRRAVVAFQSDCEYDLSWDDESKEFAADIKENEVDEILEILSEGMVVQWLKPYLYRQEVLENALNTRDYTTYSPAELLNRIGNAYKKAQHDYTQMIREYSYVHGDLTRLHL